MSDRPLSTATLTSSLDMTQPASVKQAVIALWVLIAGDVIALLIDRWMGHITGSQLYAYLFGVSLIGLLPYKISRGSRIACYICTVFFVLALSGRVVSSLVIFDEAQLLTWHYLGF